MGLTLLTVIVWSSRQWISTGQAVEVLGTSSGQALCLISDIQELRTLMSNRANKEGCGKKGLFSML
jgi:hypothetical protein